MVVFNTFKELYHAKLLIEFSDNKRYDWGSRHASGQQNGKGRRRIILLLLESLVITRSRRGHGYSSRHRRIAAA